MSPMETGVYKKTQEEHLKKDEGFLRDMQMQTVIRGQLSRWTNLSSRVFQGSMLAPILFLIYMNDVVEGVIIYADFVRIVE